MKSPDRRYFKKVLGYFLLVLVLSSTFVACGSTSSTNPSENKESVSTPVPLIGEKPSVTTPKPTEPAKTQSQSPSTTPPVVSTSEDEPDEPVGTIVYITKTGEKYHANGCRHLSQSKIEITLDDAKSEGYDPCKVCKPPR